VPSETTKSIAGRYRLLRRLGQGGMGVVWHAKDEVLHRDVAIKEILHPAGPGALGRPLREARAAAALRHPGIVTVHDIVEHDGRPWIVMALINGRSLAQQLHDDGPMPEQRAADLGLQVLQALDMAHRKGIVHRDVKPANILLDGDRAVLTDFGIAAMADATVLTGTHQLIGSPEYIAPERINGSLTGPAADLWALGVTLYYAVSGRSPFQRDDTQECLAAVLAHDPDPLPHAPRLASAIHGLLHKDPALRFTAPQVAELLSAPAPPRAREAATLDTTFEPDEPRTPPVWRTRSLTAYRKPALVTAVLIFALVTALTVWLAVFQPGTTGESRTAAPQSTPAQTTAPSLTSTQAAPPVLPGYKRFEDFRGYSIAVPHSWTRSTINGSSEYSVAGVLLFMEVDRLEDKPGADALAYLADYEKSDPSITCCATDYQRIRLEPRTVAAVSGSVAELEYAYRSRNPDRSWTYWHSLVRVVITEQGRVYVVKFRILDEDPQPLADQWQSVTPTMTTILASFRVSS
jgi:serine/threonine protein kinase